MAKRKAKRGGTRVKSPTRPRQKPGFRRSRGPQTRVTKHAKTKQSSNRRNNVKRDTARRVPTARNSSDRRKLQAAKGATAKKAAKGSRNTQGNKAVRRGVSADDKHRRQLDSLREQLRQRDSVIRDLTRHPIGRERQRVIQSAEQTDVAISSRDVPPGATVIGEDEEGNPIISLGDYVDGREWNDIDWDEVDYDDYFDDFGPDEEEVDYGGSDT